MADREPAPIIGDRTRACGGIGRRARLRALWRESSVGVRVSLGALKRPANRAVPGALLASEWVRPLQRARRWTGDLTLDVPRNLGWPPRAVRATLRSCSD